MLFVCSNWTNSKFHLWTHLHFTNFALNTSTMLLSTTIICGVEIYKVISTQRWWEIHHVPIGIVEVSTWANYFWIMVWHIFSKCLFPQVFLSVMNVCLSLHIFKHYLDSYETKFWSITLTSLYISIGFGRYTIVATWRPRWARWPLLGIYVWELYHSILDKLTYIPYPLHTITFGCVY